MAKHNTCPDCNIELVKKEEFSKKINQNRTFYECPKCKNRYSPVVEIEPYDPGRCPNCGGARLSIYVNKETNEEYEACEDCHYTLTDSDSTFDNQSPRMSYTGLGLAVLGMIMYVAGTAMVLTYDASDIETYIQNSQLYTGIGLMGVIAFMLGTIMQFLSIPQPKQ